MGVIVMWVNENVYMCISLEGCKLENWIKILIKVGFNIMWK